MLNRTGLHPGKECGYDTDIRIPLAVRGPGVAAGRVAQSVTSHTDLSPTIMKLAGHTRDDFDGLPIPLSAEETEYETLDQEHVNVEFWGRAVAEGNMGSYGDDSDDRWGFTGAIRNNTYKALRLIGNGYSLYYSVHCTGEREFYDSTVIPLISFSTTAQDIYLRNSQKDPYQLVNLFEDETAASAYSLGGRTFDQIVDRLDALMMVLKSCKAKSCQKPWKALHPGGDISTLKDALHHAFDTFYRSQPKVSFTSCELGYMLEAEGPQSHIALDSTHRHELREQNPREPSFKYEGHWSIWV